MGDPNFDMERVSTYTLNLRAGWLLAGMTAFTVQADIGPAFTGITAAANDATSTFWSPAGITRLKKPELLVQGMFVRAESKFGVDQSNIGGGDADSDNRYLLVPAVYYVHPVNDRFSMGASLTVPSGMGNDYGKDWSGRYLSEESDLTFVSLAGTLGYRLSEQWSVGGGPIMMYTDSMTKARINNIGDGRNDGRIKLEEDGVGFGWQLGLLYEFSDTARVGATYRSEIDPDLSGKPRIHGEGPLLKDALKALGVLDKHIDVDFKVPAMAQLGYYQEFMDKWSFTLDGMWLNTSAFGINHVSVSGTQVSFNGDFKDAWMFTAGMKYRYRPDLAFSVGGLHMSSPVSDNKRNIALPLDRINVIGAGVEWHWKDLLIHTNLNYADLGDGNLDQKGGLAGRIKGSFERNHAVILDMQLVKRF
jgi:long-chain fatty acid transport protein